MYSLVENVGRRLVELGWMPSDAASSFEKIEACVEQYQGWFGLPDHGHLDPVTLRHLQAPRFCGHPDKMEATASDRWTKRKLLWTLTGGLAGVLADPQRAAFVLAWQMWADVCGIHAEWTSDASKADIRIGTGRIDGPMGTLAWSELPNGTDRQLSQLYDTGEPWVIEENPTQGKIDLVRVACHEIGHALGLPHLAGGNLLQPTYDPRIRKPQAGDIAEVVRRYGKPTVNPTPPPLPPPTPSPSVIEIRVFGADRIEIPGYTVKPI